MASDPSTPTPSKPANKPAYEVPVCAGEIKSAYLDWLKSLTQAQLTQIIQSDKRFTKGGFRLTQPALIAHAIAQVCPTPCAISEPIRQTMTQYLAPAQFFERLSVEAITELRRICYVLWGKAFVLLALQWDCRECVRDLAQSWTSQKDFPLPTPDHAHATLSKAFRVLGTNQDAPSKQVKQQSLYDELAQLRQQLKSLRASEEHARQQAQLLTKTQKQLDTTLEQLRLSEQQVRVHTRQIAQLTAELQRESEQRDLCLKAELDHRLATEFHGWLNPPSLPLPTDPVAKQRATDQFERALTAQLNLDPHAAAHLNEIRLAQAEAALQFAIKRHPGLVQFVKDARRSVPTPDPLVSAILQAIQTLDQAHYPNLRLLIDKAHQLNILQDAAAQTLYDAFHKRAATWALEGEVDLAEKGDTEPTNSDLLAQKYPHLALAMTGKAPVIVLIDGHNMIYGLPGRYSPKRGKPLMEADKRNRLIKDITRSFFNLPTSRAWILFDGATASEQAVSENVRVSFSGGVGEHRADRVLVDLIRFFKQLNDSTQSVIPIYLVSNDQGLCGDARKQGAQTITIHHFAAFLTTNPL